MDASALASALALAASLAPGVSVAPPPAAVPPVRAQVAAPGPAPTRLSVLPLSELADHQGVFLRREISGMAVDFSVDFGPDEDPRLLLRESGKTQAFTLAALQAGTTAVLSRGTVALSLKQDTITAGTAQVTLNDLLLTVYNAAAWIRFPAVKYSLLLAGTVDKPQAVVTLRRDSEGVFWVAYHPVAKLGEILWLCAVDDTLYGMKLEGNSLSFWSKRLPPQKSR